MINGFTSVIHVMNSMKIKHRFNFTKIKNTAILKGVMRTEKRASHIKDKNGNLTCLDKSSPNHWAFRCLWT